MIAVWSMVFMAPSIARRELLALYDLDMRPRESVALGSAWLLLLGRVAVQRLCDYGVMARWSHG